MTVRELHELLNQYDDNTLIYFLNRDDGAYASTCEITKFKDGWIGLRDDFWSVDFSLNLELEDEKND